MNHFFVIFGGLDDAVASHDLLKAIEIPLRDETTINFTPGPDGFPAFTLFHGHDIKIPHKVLLPEKLDFNFSILATVKPANGEGELVAQSEMSVHFDKYEFVLSAGGYLFAVVDPLDTLVQFGVKISPGGPGRSNISMYYSSPNLHFSSQVKLSVVNKAL